MSRKLFIAPTPLVGFVFRNAAGEKMLITNDTFAPTDLDVTELTPTPFDINIQATVDNVQAKLDAAKAEIQTAIENFEE